MPDNNVRF